MQLIIVSGLPDNATTPGISISSAWLPLSPGSTRHVSPSRDGLVIVSHMLKRRDSTFCSHSNTIASILMWRMHASAAALETPVLPHAEKTMRCTFESSRNSCTGLLPSRHK